jgi:hypothetical protein
MEFSVAQYGCYFFPLPFPQIPSVEDCVGYFIGSVQHSTGTSCTEVNSILKNGVVKCACVFITE